MSDIVIEEKDLIVCVYGAKTGVAVEVCLGCAYYDQYHNPLLNESDGKKIIGSCSFSVNCHTIGLKKTESNCKRS